MQNAVPTEQIEHPLLVAWPPECRHGEVILEDHQVRLLCLRPERGQGAARHRTLLLERGDCYYKVFMKILCLLKLIDQFGWVGKLDFTLRRKILLKFPDSPNYLQKNSSTRLQGSPGGSSIPQKNFLQRNITLLG